MVDFGKIKSSVILTGSNSTAYRDPAVYFDGERFYLFGTYVECQEGGPYLTVVESISTDLINWSKPREITVRDRSCNFSSPGNVIRADDGYYYLCVQSYCRENGEKYGNERSRVFTMRSTDLINWDAPRLMRVKGDIPEEEMGRMIDPFLIKDIADDKKWWCLYKQNGVSASYSYDLENWTYSGRTESGENVCAIRRDDGYLIFHSPPNGIAVLKTNDMQSFEPYGSLITLGQDGWEWAKGRITAGFVLDLKKEPSVGKYIMFFHGSGPEPETTMFDHNASIGIAWTDDDTMLDWNYIW